MSKMFFAGILAAGAAGALIAPVAAQGATLVGDSPAEFRTFLDNEIKKWAKVIKDAGVKTEK